MVVVVDGLEAEVVLEELVHAPSDGGGRRLVQHASTHTLQIRNYLIF